MSNEAAVRTKLASAIEAYDDDRTGTLGDYEHEAGAMLAKMEAVGLNVTSDAKQLQCLNDLEEACRLLTGMLDAFDERWTGDKPPPKIYYRVSSFLERMLPQRIGSAR